MTQFTIRIFYKERFLSYNLIKFRGTMYCIVLCKVLLNLGFWGKTVSWPLIHINIFCLLTASVFISGDLQASYCNFYARNCNFIQEGTLGSFQLSGDSLLLLGSTYMVNSGFVALVQGLSSSCSSPYLGWLIWIHIELSNYSYVSSFMLHFYSL